MGEALDRYLELEKELLKAQKGYPKAGGGEDKILDQMDRVWYTLTDEEIAFLNERK